MNRSARRSHRVRHLFATGLLVGTLAATLGGLAPRADAQTSAITVTSFEDKPNRNSTDTTCNNDGLFDGKCSLRAAIMAANNRAGLTTIVVPPGTYTLDRFGRAEQGGLTGDLDARADMIIRPSTTTGRIVIRGASGWDDRLLHVHANAVVRIERADLKDGNTVPSNEAGGAARVEGGGQFIVVNSTLSDSAATGGGGLFVAPSASASIEQSSRIHHNRANSNDGGGVLTDGGFEAADSVIDLNSAFGHGGGIAIRVGGATLTNATVRDNSNVTNPGGATPAGGGGGISNANVLIATDSIIEDNDAGATGGGGLLALSGSATTLDRVRIAGNRTGLGNANGVAGVPVQPGGGLRVLGGVLNLSASAVIANTAGPGGGVHVAAGEVNIRNTTISTNTATNSGGGVFQAGGLLRLLNATVASNTVLGTGAGRDGGGLKSVNSTPQVANTLIADNSAALKPDCNATINSLGFNLVENATGCAGLDSADLVNVAPGLAPLSTDERPFHALNVGSAALDAGSAAAFGTIGACEPVDQRNVRRPRDGDGNGSARCDIGAIERVSVTQP